MRADVYPLQVLLAALAGWMNRHQQDVIAYLVEENRVLKEQLKGKRMRLTDDQRRRLAAKAKRLGRKVLNRIVTIVTPDTLMRWHRRLIALKWIYAAKRVGRPGLMKKIAALIVCMARDNSSWGYCRIQGELRALGYRVAPSTIAKVLKDNGIRPAPERPSSWRPFLKAHWGQIAGLPHCDNYQCIMRFAPTVEAIDTRGDWFCYQCIDQFRARIAASRHPAYGVRRACPNGAAAVGWEWRFKAWSAARARRLLVKQRRLRRCVNRTGPMPSLGTRFRSPKCVGASALRLTD